MLVRIFSFDLDRIEMVLNLNQHRAHGSKRSFSHCIVDETLNQHSAIFISFASISIELASFDGQHHLIDEDVIIHTENLIEFDKHSPHRWYFWNFMSQKYTQSSWHCHCCSHSRRRKTNKTKYAYRKPESR